MSHSDDAETVEWSNLDTQRVDDERAMAEANRMVEEMGTEKPLHLICGPEAMPNALAAAAAAGWRIETSDRSDDEDYSGINWGPVEFVEVHSPEELDALPPATGPRGYVGRAGAEALREVLGIEPVRLTSADTGSYSQAKLQETLHLEKLRGWLGDRRTRAEDPIVVSENTLEEARMHSGTMLTALALGMEERKREVEQLPIEIPENTRRGGKRKADAKRKSRRQMEKATRKAQRRRK